LKKQEAENIEGIMRNFFKEYFSNYYSALNKFLKNRENAGNLFKAVVLLKKTKNSNSRIYLIGNGGSAAIAEHMAIDLTKNARLRAIALSGSPMLTTFSNDYGYENVFQKAIECFAEKKDLLIAISSSGTSKNILNACDAARKKKMTIITFSAFESDNLLRKKGDLNFWVDSKAFGYVEIIHNLLIHYINDCIIGSAEYMIR
jgi:D-sedoheptulose 7-phosphate isomerase